jgi:superfamily II DNA helicase RecQ
MTHCRPTMAVACNGCEIPPSGKEFSHFANEIKLMGKLDRIVWDEIHKWITDTYRPKMMDSSDWMRDVPAIYITATWPPSLQRDFMRRWKIEDETTIRIANQKPRVRYTVCVFKDDEFE